MIGIRRAGWIYLVLLCASFPARAGGPYIITESGTASLWDNTNDIEVHPESGSCATYSSSGMATTVEEVLAIWSGLDEVLLSFDVISGEIGSVDADNYTDYFSASGDVDQDDLSPIIFDDDGEITAEVAGEGNQYAVLGFASSAVFTSDGSEILEGQAVINCLCIEGNDPCDTDTAGSIVFPLATMEFTILHEMGHFLNLDHTQVNIDLLLDASNTDYEDLPVMFPYIMDPDTQMTPHWDDIAALASLYPSDTFADEICTVSGDLTDTDGNPVRCADVWAVGDDISDTAAFVSGTLAVASDSDNDGDTVDSGECESGCGHFDLKLQIGKDYTISVLPIYSDFTGGSGMGPCYLDQLNTISEEEIATVTAAQCTAGSTIDLGTIETLSTGAGTGDEPASPVDDGDDITVGGESGLIENPDGWWCSLRVSPSSQISMRGSELALVLLVLGLVWSLRQRRSL